MATDIEDAFHWFESLCDDFSRDPQRASEELSRFRETEQAISVSQVVIQNSTKSHVQFHALAVLQHAYLTHYHQFSDEQNREIRDFLWLVVLDKSISHVLDQSVITKVIHTYAIVVKRNWITDSHEQRSKIFNMISALVCDDESDHTLLRYKIASKILSSMLEVFANKKRTPDESIGFSPEAFSALHHCFQEDKTFNGLFASFHLAMQLLSKAFDLSKEMLFDESEGDRACFDHNVASVVKAIYDLVMELFGWDHDSRSMSYIDLNEKAEYGAVRIPNDWVDAAGGAVAFNDILRQLIGNYNVMRLALFGPKSVEECVNTVDGILSKRKLQVGCTFGESEGKPSLQISVRIAGEYLSSIRQLILTFSSISSKSNSSIFVTDAEKIYFADLISQEMMTVLGYCIDSLTTNNLVGVGSNLSQEQVEELLLGEIEHAIYILIRLYGNFGLSILGQTASFESFMVMRIAGEKFATHLI